MLKIDTILLSLVLSCSSFRQYNVVLTVQYHMEIYVCNKTHLLLWFVSSETKVHINFELREVALVTFLPSLRDFWLASFSSSSTSPNVSPPLEERAFAAIPFCSLLRVGKITGATAARPDVDQQRNILGHLLNVDSEHNQMGQIHRYGYRYGMDI
ncbi:unnamed protein product [Sympodiomycopsis kandeliae]